MLNRLVELTRQRKNLEADLDPILEELASVRDAVVAEFVREGTQNWKSADGALVYLNRKLFASMKPGVDPAAACEILRSNGFDFVVETKPSSTKLAAWIREQEQMAEGVLPESLDGWLPEKVRELFVVSEQHVPGVRGA